MKADPSKSKETHTKSNQRNQDQLTPPHVAKSVPTALNKQTGQAKDKTATQTVAKDVKAAPSKSRETHTKSNKRNQDQVTPPHLAKSVPTDLDKQTATQTLAKDVKAAPSRPKEIHTKSNKKNQEQVTLPQLAKSMPADLDKQTEAENKEIKNNGSGKYALSKYKGYVYVPISDAGCTPEPPLPKKRCRLPKVSLDFDYMSL